MSVSVMYPEALNDIKQPQISHHGFIARSVPSLNNVYGNRDKFGQIDLNDKQPQNTQLFLNAHQHKMHQQRLEQRSKLLEDQNRQLQIQLKRLQNMVEMVGFFQ